MSRYFLLLVVGIISPTYGRGQLGNWVNYKVQTSDKFYIGSTEDCLVGCYVYLQFAKPMENIINAPNGMVRISVQNVSNVSYVRGNMIFFTTGGQRIIFRDIGLNYNLSRDGIQTAESIYYLTTSEAQLIVREGICEVHFNIVYDRNMNFSYALRPVNCMQK